MEFLIFFLKLFLTLLLNRKSVYLTRMTKLIQKADSLLYLVGILSESNWCRKLGLTSFGKLLFLLKSPSSCGSFFMTPFPLTVKYLNVEFSWLVAATVALVLNANNHLLVDSELANYIWHSMSRIFVFSLFPNDSIKARLIRICSRTDVLLWVSGLKLFLS